MNDDTERAARRYAGLAFWGVGTLLGAWGWTLKNATYGATLDDLLRKAINDPDVDLTYAREWAASFYGVDTLLYIPCYLGFGLLITRQLQRSLRRDVDSTEASIRAFVHLFLSVFATVARWLLIALVLADLFENGSALAQLLAYSHDATYVPSAIATGIFAVASPVKATLIGALVAWLVAATLVWLTGAALPVQSELLAVRRSVRDGLIDVLSRTRYCLLTALTYAALMLGIDQAQDVLTGLAGFTRETLSVAVSLLLAVALGVFALHTHSHAVWVWSRLLVRMRGQYRPDPAACEPITTFAKWWGRFLGASPWFIVLTLCVRTAGSASHLRDTDTTWLLLTAGALATIWGIGFILWKEREGRSGLRKGRPYYSSDDDEATLLRDEAYRFLGFIKPSPLWIPLVAIAGIVLVRYFYSHEVLPAACHALAAISFGFALWSSIVNRLALNSLRTRFPWILSLFAIIAAFAALGLTQNHTLLAGDDIARTSSGASSLKHMFWLTFFLALGIAIAYGMWLAFKSRWTVNQRLVGSWALFLGWTAIVLWQGARGDAQEPPIPSSTLDARKSLQVAVTDWLKARNQNCGEGCSSISVYLVAAEGGGIRAAYYSAPAQ